MFWLVVGVFCGVLLVGFFGYFGLFWGFCWLVGGWVLFWWVFLFGCCFFFTFSSVDMIYNFCLAGGGRDTPPSQPDQGK